METFSSNFMPTWEQEWRKWLIVLIQVWISWEMAQQERDSGLLSFSSWGGWPAFKNAYRVKCRRRQRAGKSEPSHTRGMDEGMGLHDGLLVKTPCFHCRGCEFNPRWGDLSSSLLHGMPLSPQKWEEKKYWWGQKAYFISNEVVRKSLKNSFLNFYSNISKHICI